ncbi:hypothetical protein LTR94_036024, partial [Friedmanniomyces endolithicus]
REGRDLRGTGGADRPGQRQRAGHAGLAPFQEQESPRGRAGAAARAGAGELRRGPPGDPRPPGADEAGAGHQGRGENPRDGSGNADGEEPGGWSGLSGGARR